MDHEDWAGCLSCQFDCALLSHGSGPGCRREHLWRRVEAPAHSVFAQLGGVRLWEDATEEELKESPMVAQPVVGVVLHPVDVFVAPLLETCIRCSLDRCPWFKRHPRPDENGGGDTFRMLSGQQQRP